MANEYSVNQSDLVSVANAIRTKGGTSETLVFPDGFVSAVQAIQAGGGSGTGLTLDDVYCVIVNYDVDADSLTLSDGILLKGERKIVS